MDHIRTLKVTATPNIMAKTLARLLRRPPPHGLLVLFLGGLLFPHSFPATLLVGSSPTQPAPVTPTVAPTANPTVVPKIVPAGVLDSPDDAARRQRARTSNPLSERGLVKQAENFLKRTTPLRKTEDDPVSGSTTMLFVDAPNVSRATASGQTDFELFVRVLQESASAFVRTRSSSSEHLFLFPVWGARTKFSRELETWRGERVEAWRTLSDAFAPGSGSMSMSSAVVRRHRGGRDVTVDVAAVLRAQVLRSDVFLGSSSNGAGRVHLLPLVYEEAADESFVTRRKKAAEELR